VERDGMEEGGEKGREGGIEWEGKQTCRCHPTPIKFCKEVGERRRGVCEGEAERERGKVGERERERERREEQRREEWRRERGGERERHLAENHFILFFIYTIHLYFYTYVYIYFPRLPQP
jgi:hypothetical protein